MTTTQSTPYSPSRRPASEARHLFTFTAPGVADVLSDHGTLYRGVTADYCPCKCSQSGRICSHRWLLIAAEEALTFARVLVAARHGVLAWANVAGREGDCACGGPAFAVSVHATDPTDGRPVATGIVARVCAVCGRNQDRRTP